MLLLNNLIKRFNFISIVLVIFLLGCDGGEDQTLAPYSAVRPLIWEQITRAYNPDIQWLGGRIAAVGVNLGTVAALDSTLIWLTTMDDNVISSYATVGVNTDSTTILSFAGTPSDTLENNSTYTFWIADKDIFDSRLDTNLITNHSFIDSTIKIKLGLSGLKGGQRNLISSFTVERERTLLEEKIHVSWEPSDRGFRQLVLRTGTNGEYTNRLYHIITRDDSETIYPPVTIGVGDTTNLIVAVEYIPFSLKKGKLYFLWMSTSQWTEGNFSSSAWGYATFAIRKIKD
ncbi:MAG: hypothetical protein H8E14_10085 [Candidatus Marinimicrobia bacterium]|nr:hypothetical protein [Candidatus Neomarinimicrobiota bacterium]